MRLYQYKFDTRRLRTDMFSFAYSYDYPISDIGGSTRVRTHMCISAKV